MTTNRDPDGTSGDVDIDRYLSLDAESPAEKLADPGTTAAMLQEVRTVLAATLDNVDQGIMMVDGRGRVHVCNRRAIEILGLPPELMARKPHFQEIVDYQLAASEFENDDITHRVAKSGDIRGAQPVYERVRPNGIAIEVRTVALPDGGIVRTFTDITERRAREAALKTAEAEYRSLFENAVVGIYRSSVDGKQIRANPALVRLNGYANEKEMLAAVNDIAAEWYVQAGRRDEFARLMKEQGRVTDFVSEIYRHATRDRIWVSETAWIVHGANGESWFEGTVLDATERKLAEARIAHVALHDALTDLPNRVLFIEQMAAAVTSDDKACAVHCIDLDGFKEVNDSLGHAAGDALLCAVAQRLMSAVRHGDMVARLGGDEFAIIQREAPDRATAAALATSVVDALSHPFNILGQRVMIGASVGVAIVPDDGGDAETLLKHADMALYRAKQEGRRTWRFFDPHMTEAVRARRALERDLRDAIGRDEFAMHFQPIVDVLTRRPIAYEALLRWFHPERGSVPPSEFVPVAEDVGLMGSIGTWALDEACRQAAAAPEPISIAVNLSPAQFQDRNVVDVVRATLSLRGLPPTRLIVEITESVLLMDDARTLAALNELRALGVRITLDDFGIGHSSLSYLQKFPFDKLKIDRLFIARASNGPNAAIVRAMINLGRDLGIDVIAEGVETVEQLNTLVAEGCRHMQGYLFAQPGLASDIFGARLAGPTSWWAAPPHEDDADEWVAPRVTG